jgi:hypothetical protein
MGRTPRRDGVKRHAKSVDQRVTQGVCLVAALKGDGGNTISDGDSNKINSGAWHVHT